MSRLLCTLAVLAASGASAETLRARVSAAAHNDVSPPLWLIRPAPPTPRAEHEPRRFPRRHALGPVYDPVVQSSVTPAAPPTSTDFEAMGDGFTGPVGTFSPSGTPPDTDGAVGPNDYVSLVNSALAVIDKTGTPTFGPVQTNTLFSGFSSTTCADDSTAQCACQIDDDGDGIVLYDRAADRWFLTQFAVSGFINGTTTTTWQCVAISKTGDPSGQWYRYVFDYPDKFNDYGKFGTWPDGYYATYNTFDTSQAWAGGLACVFDRASMLTGAAATQQCVSLGVNYGGLLPTDLDGPTAPPAGEPNFIVGFNEGPARLQLWTFHVDWTTPANTALSGPTDLGVADFTVPCNDGAGGNFTCVVEPIPQGQTSETLDTLGDRMMFRLAYRNFGDHESLVANHTVTGSNSNTGVRWYEVRDPNGTPTVYQQGTYAPDASFRWMGSIAMDGAGDIALGYSVSDSTLDPSVNYTGRLASDTLGEMAQGEARMFTGTGSEVGLDSHGQPITRWGDYSSMTVDPTDDCTFWYAGEYLATDGQFNWHTRVGHFKFPGCGAVTADDFGITVTPPAAGTTIAPGASADYAIDTTVIGAFSTPIDLTVTGLPAGVTPSFDSSTIDPGASATLTLTVDSGASPVTDTSFTVTGTAGAAHHDATSTVSVSADDFSIALTPTGATTVAPGNSVDYSIDTAVTSGGPESIALSIGTLPTGVTAVFADNPILSGSSTVVTLSAAAGAPNHAAASFTVTGTAASGHHGATSTVAVAAPNVFSLALDPSSGIALAAGGTTTVTVHSAITTGDNSETIALSVAVGSLPAGVTGSFNPGSIHAGDSSVLTLTADTSAVSGDGSTLEVDGSSISDSENATADVTIVAGDFSLAISPSSATAAPGSTATFTVSATAVTGAPAGIALAISGALPTGVTAAFSPDTIDPGTPSTLTLTVAASAPAVSGASFTVTGTDSDGISHPVVGHVTVSSTGGGGGNDFGLSLSPASQTVAAGHTATVTVSTSLVSGTAESIALSVSGLPSGVTGSFGSSSVTAGSSTTLTLTAASTAPAVTSAAFTVTGLATSATHAAGGTVTVTTGSSGGGGGAPTATVTNPSSGATVSGSVEIDATGAPGAGATLVKIEIKIDDTVIGSPASSPAQIFWQSTEFTDGTHNITARAVDFGRPLDHLRGGDRHGGQRQQRRRRRQRRRGQGRLLVGGRWCICRHRRAGDVAAAAARVR